MRKKIIASIILIIMLWQAIGNCCLAVVNEISMNESSQEVNTTTANNVLNENTEEETNMTNADETRLNSSAVTNNELETSSSNQDANKSMEVGNQYITEDDLLYSNKYLVKDRVVSRIDPKTTILEFKQGVEIAKGNELKFYKNDGVTEVTQGILGTGMLVRGTNGQEYKLSVKGDMTGEGETNQVELTMMIRHVIELQGWELTDVNAASGDITGDGEINLVDVNKMIKHIVYGDWEYDTRTTPNPPTIEVIGEEGEEADLYTSEVKVRIVEDKSTENLKTTYKLSGKVEKEESSIEEDEEITISEDGEYLITAYTYGAQGNRSKASNRKIVINTAEQPEQPDEPETPEIYNITYELNGGTNNSENPSTYTYGTEVTLKDPTREGYTFEGWYKEAEFTNKIEKIETTQIGDITVYAKWNVNNYSIIYELNGGTNSSENPATYTYGTETILKDPTREGYTFEGWYKEAEFTNKIEKIETTQIGDITVYAKWNVNNYSIIYELNGGTNSSENPATYTYGTETILKDPTREGFTFDGWYKETEFINKIEKIEATQTGDITVYARWSASKYDITYELNGGTNSSENPDQYTYGEETVLKDPTKEGNTFDGWYKDPEFINKIEKTEITQIGEITVYAKWIVNEYNIIYELNGGTNSSENVDKYTYGTEITLKDPTKEGYTFEGWYKEAEFTNKIEKIESTQTGDITVYAKWSASKYDITYELNGGTNSSENPDQYTYGEETILKDPTKEGYTFDGWYTEPEFINKIEKTEITQIGDITIYAKWIVNEYNITYELNGGINSSENVDKYTYGTEITLKDPTREGYTFDGWYKESEFTNKIEKIESTQTGDITVYAKWSANKYDITYELNGGTNSSENPDQYTYGEETILQDPTKEGYTFDGWYTEPEFINKIEKTEITQTEDITIYAKWIIDEYQITYELDGGINSSENVDKYTYGTEITFKDPTKEGYTFEGWYKESEFTNKIEKIEATQTGDITVYAKWNQNEYTIQATAQDGGVVENETETVKHGENSTKQIKIIPNADMQVDTITINDVEFLDYEEDEDTGIVILPIFENVTENKNIVITFGEILPVVKIIAAPEGYEDLVGKEYKKITKALEDITTDGVTLQLIADTKEEVTLADRQITLDLNGKSVKGNATTITLENSNLTLINSNSSEQGKIISVTETAIYVKDSGTFSLGQNEGTVETDKMLIQGETSGVKNEGTFNFYDGTITATKAIDGEATEVPLRYNISIGEQDSKQVATLQVMAGAEAAIGQKTFFKLEEAIAYANESIATDGSQVEVTIIDNVQKTSAVEVADSKNIKLNLNGYEVSFLNGDDGIINNGKLEIVDTIGTGKITSTMSRAISNKDGAELTITSGMLEATGSGSYGIYNSSTGAVMVTGGTITANSTGLYIDTTGTGTVKVTGGAITSNSASAISNNGSGEVFVGGGTVTGYTKGINNYNEGTVTMTGGTVTAARSSGYGIYNYSEGTVTMTGGTLTVAGNNSYGIYNNSTGTVTMNNGEIFATVSGVEGIHNRTQGAVIINGGKMSLSGTYNYGIFNNYTGSVTVNNVEITVTGTDGRGIYNYESGTVKMSGGIITSAARGIENYATGAVKITGGTIKAGTTAIYNRSTGTITIGEKDGTASDTLPSINGTNYGIWNESSGKINFYDGRIEGNINQSLACAVNEIEEGYNIIQTIEDSREISTLGNIEYFKVVETDTVYSNLQDAIDSIDTEEVQTIQVLSNTIISADRGATNDKNIVLDLNGKTIKSGKSGTIDNRGTLEIIDSSEDKTASMTALQGKAVVNEEGATLKITGGTITNTLGYTSAIENMGILQVDGGTIQTTGSVSYSIKNNGAGTITIGGGTISSTGDTTIYNSSTGTVTVDGGTITGNYEAIYNASTGKVVINGGKITTQSGEPVIYNESGIITVKGGEIIAYTRGKGIENKNGIITIEGGSISGGQYGIYNSSTGTVTVTGGTVQAASYQLVLNWYEGYGIYNYSTGTVIMTGGTVKTTSGTTVRNTFGIYNNSTGTVKVTGGIIEADITASRGYGIYNRSTGEITVGEKDGDVSITVPSITGGVYGLCNNTTGKANFYDGIIKGPTGQSIYGSLNEIEDEYDVVKTVDETTSTETAILQKLPVIINTSTNTEYYSIQTAITEAGENEILQVARDTVTTSTDETIVVEADKNVVLDLNGYGITFGQVTAIRNLGKLTIEDGSEGKTGNIMSTVGNIITNEDGAILNITGGTIKTTESSSPAIYNDLTGTVTVEGGSIIAANSGIKTSETSTGTVKVTDGTITSTGASGIASNGSGEVIVEGGTVTGYANGINNYSIGTVTVTGGTVISNGYNGYTYGIYNNSTGKVTINGGTVTSDGYYGSNYGIYNNSTGIVVIDGGTVTAESSVYNSYGIYNNSTGTVTIDSGAVIVKVSGGYGIYNNSEGTVTLNGGTVTTEGDSCYGIYNCSTGTVTMTGGTITSTARGIVNNAEGIVIMTGGTITAGTGGIYNNSTGTITIGEKDGTVNDTNPSITGTNYGIYNPSTGAINFYDGIIKGATGQSIYGIISEIEDEYDVIRTTDVTTSTETAILQKAPSIINTTTSKEYYSIQTAITEAGENDTLQVLRSIMILPTQETIVVEADKDVVLDLNGYNITFGQATAIRNLGELTIEDASEGKTGNILSTVGNIITNEEGATLDITGGTIKSTKSDSSAIYNDSTGIVTVEGGSIIAASTGIKTSSTSTGTVKIVGGTTTSNGASGISNNGSGEVIVEGGTVTGYINGINNYSTGTVTVCGGVVTSIRYDGNNYGIYNNSTGIVIIDGGTITANTSKYVAYGIYNNSTGTVIIADGIVTGIDYGIYNNSTGTVTIDGGTVKVTAVYSEGIYNWSEGIVTVNGGTVVAESSYSEGIWNYSSGTIIVTGGTVTAAGSNSNGIYNTSTGTITVTGGTVTAAGSNSNGIYNTSTGTITVTGGTVTATESNSYGIYNNSSATITIGEKDGIVSTSVPSVTGAIYGIYTPSSGILNFYDGIIKGSTHAISGNVTDIETNYQIKYSESNTIATLEPVATNYKSISIGDIYYETLQAAVNDAQDGATIELWADVILESTVEIPEGLNITIELNGNNLTGNGLDVLINNKGTVNVIDSVGTGSITNPDGETIKDIT